MLSRGETCNRHPLIHIFFNSYDLLVFVFCNLNSLTVLNYLLKGTEISESGLKGGFHENISYDYSKCCAKKGISPLCQAMCKPRDMHIHHFDPTR